MAVRLSSVLIVSAPWHPIRESIDSVALVSDEIVVGVDSSHHGMVSLVESLAKDRPIKVLRSAQTTERELARRTLAAVDAARGDWILYLHDSECLHEAEHARLLEAVREAPAHVTGFKIDRLFFSSRPDILRSDLTRPLIRAFRPGSHLVTGDAESAVTIWGKAVRLHGVGLYRYSGFLEPDGSAETIGFDGTHPRYIRHWLRSRLQESETR